MPQESFAVSFGYPDVVVQNVQHLVDRIGDPGPGTTIAGVLGSPADATTIAGAVQATRGQLGTVNFGTLANDAGTAATQAANAAVAVTAIGSFSLPGTTLASVVGTPNTPGTIAFNVQATKSQLGTVDFDQLASNLSAVASKLGPIDFSTFATKEDIRQLQWLVLKLWWLDHMCGYFFHQRAETAVGVACHHAGLGDAARRDSVTGEELSRVADQYHLPHPPPPELENVLRTAKAFAAHLPTPPRTAARSARP
jgi:hypothetical protein